VGTDFGGSAPSVTVIPDGAYVYVTHPPTGTVVVFGRDASTGLLSFA
jgi:DNA-binding beta-propeller fold protein YncE